MSLLIFALVVLVILAMVCWLIQTAPMLDGRLKWVIQAIAVIIAILAIAQRAGVL